MNPPKPSIFDGSIQSSYHAVLQLQEEINRELISSFERLMHEDRETLARELVAQVERIVDELNGFGYGLGRSDYGGSMFFEESEQTYSSGSEAYFGRSLDSKLTIRFHGFSAQVSWGGPLFDDQGNHIKR